MLREPLPARRFELAPTTGIDRVEAIAQDFMRRILDYDPGDYLITDESSLFDFTDIDQTDFREIYEQIQAVYHLDVSDIADGNLLAIFHRIAQG